MIPNSLQLEVGACSETGYVRNENQDRMSWATIPLGHLYLVADGMGGHAGGARAAEMTIRGLERNLSDAQSLTRPIDDVIRSAFDDANREVYEKGHDGDPSTAGMGSTAVMLLIHERAAKIAHVGDSRAYLYRSGRLHPLTKDHTQVQQMVDEGLLSPEQARNHPYSSVLDRAIGNRPTVEADISADLALKNGDGILLCSDGLTGYADDSEIESAIDASLSAQENVDRLIDLALQKGGEDNVTLQFVRFRISADARWQPGKHPINAVVMALLILGLIAGAVFLI
ncbi:MAG: PP2C family protein-serine/threonine phosphatase [Gammaproteobacteria bacterium]